MAAILVSTASLTAANSYEINETLKIEPRYRFAEPVVFVEAGIEFLIFPDGSFDFNTAIVDRFADSRYAEPIRTGADVYASRRSRTDFVDYDPYGVILRVGPVFIGYDNMGRIIKAGSVRMDYQKGNNRLKRVGKLKVNYNHWGEIVHYKGAVNNHNSGTICFTHHHTTDYNGNDHNGHLDPNYYYYKKDNKVKKIKKHKRNKK